MISTNTSFARSARRSYSSLTEFAPEWIVAPGDTIADLLEERGWTQAELAMRTGFTTKHVNQLLKGEAPITQETAAKLEKVLGSTVRFWMGLDTQYREQRARSAELAALAKEGDWLKALPLADMIRFGWVEKMQDKALQVKECLKFFAVSDVAAWRATYENSVAAYRASPKLIKVGPAISAWLRKGERDAGALRCADFNKVQFELALVRARTLTQEPSLNKFLPDLQRICAAAGVAIVIAPAPKGCPVSGATKWLATNKAIIMLSVRGKTDDKLWFTFFHEAGHLLKHGKSLTFLDILGEAGLNDQEEEEADVFARDFLVQPSKWSAFVAQQSFTSARVGAFAKAQGVSAGIVVGRLQFEKHIQFTHLNTLKVSFQWAHES